MSAATPQLETLAYGPDLWRRVQQVWRDLGARADRTSAFLSEAWVDAWLSEFGSELRPRALVWRARDGVPVGCALVSVGRGRRGPFAITQMFLNASGAGQPGCEHNEPLVLAPARDAVLDDLVRVARESQADELALVGVGADTARALMARWPVPRHRGYFSEAPHVPLERLRAEGRPYLEYLSANTRSQIRRSRRLYEERFGAPRFEVATGSEADAWLAELIGLHEERWSAKGKTGAFGSPAARRFHARILARCAGVSDPDALGVDIARVRFGDETIGLLYNLRYRRRIAFYQSGFRYADDNRMKPGLVAHSLAIEHYLASDQREYDFLGGETESVQYKRSLATDVRELAWIQLPAPGLKMRALDALAGARRRMRPGPRTPPAARD